MTKAHILIVEDEALLYRRLKKVLLKENYSIDQYTVSVEEALKRINLNTPDIILLDIKLDGELSGIDLGKILDEKYHIPFIYVTDFDDNQTFFQGLSTNHEQYIVKTKPQLDPKEIIRAIQTVLKRNEIEKPMFTKEAVIGLIDYLDQLKSLGANAITQIPVKYKDIGFFTTKPFINQNEKEEELRDNYIWFSTTNGKNDYYFLKKSLSHIEVFLPPYFVRINESYIVNISPEILGGRINGTKLSILNRELIITDTYKKGFKKRFEMIYHT